MNEALQFLDSLQGSGIRPGLGRMRTLLRPAGNPHRAFSTVIVAGTNGKGSTAATLASILRASGYRTGLYVSPHLVHLTERWLIDGKPVSMAALQEAIARLRSAIRKAKISPTYFEALTVLAFLIFRAAECDVVVLETGLGGRLDATNVTRPLLALISAIGIDHVEYLGSGLHQIAREKAGVIHRGAAVATSNTDEEIIRIIERRASRFGAVVHRSGSETAARRVRIVDWRLKFSLSTPAGRYRIDSPLVGFHQIENISLAIRGAELLAPRFAGLSFQTIEEGVRETHWRGRLERFVVGGKTVIVDGAHNSHAARRIAEFIDGFVPSPRSLVFGIMKDKDVDAVESILFPRFASITLTEPDPERTASTGALRRTAVGMGIPTRIVADPKRAVREALNGAEPWVVVCGSLYLAGAAVAFLDRIARER